MENNKLGMLHMITLRYEKGEINISPHEIDKMLIAAEALEQAYMAVKTAKRIADIKIPE